MSWSEVYKINTDMEKPLNTLIDEKTAVKIQTVTFAFTNQDSAISVTIEPIDISKSIIVPLSAFDWSAIGAVSLSYNFDSSTSIRCTRLATANPHTFNNTVMVMTFGGTVN